MTSETSSEGQVGGLRWKNKVQAKVFAKRWEEQETGGRKKSKTTQGLEYVKTWVFFLIPKP